MPDARSDDVVQRLKDRLAGMTPEAKRALDRELATEAEKLWHPDQRNRPQVEAFYSAADVLLYGGAAGGGKTDLLIGLATTAHNKAVIFRNAYVDLTGVEQRILEIYPRPAWNGGDLILKWEDRILELGALAKPGAEYGWRGRPHDFVGVDEAADVAADKIRFVLGWLRSTKPGQRKRAVLASNPPIGGSGEYLIEWFAPWLDPMFAEPAKPGELRWCVVDPAGETVWVEGPGLYEIEGDTEPREAHSRTFIPALMKDNPYLAGTGYEKQIDALPEPLRTQLKTGDFMAGRKDHALQVIPSAWVDAATERWKAGKPRGQAMTAVGADVAVSIDETVISRLYGTWFDQLIKHPGKATATGPETAGIIIAARRGTAEIAIDMTGGWGLMTRDALAGMEIDVTPVVFSAAGQGRDRSGKLKFKNKRAELWWKFREALDPEAPEPENVGLPDDRRLKAQLTAPRFSVVNGEIKIESKDDVAERLGSSTDDADAVIIAWSVRHQFMTPTERRKGRTQEHTDQRDVFEDWDK